ncbi:hypothetical protein LRS03_05205 [Rhizobacter sp. J219]|uniref:hypothetical protein n=1 Tax=Rhizobacter sp. J219 TaxID=2898430 RepID=UPI002151517D|nr:hypothetical protein [Rhizobacter sp. J219]MCR5882289.1 hypothetical protein [Rhizobacter sp. J219]
MAFIRTLTALSSVALISACATGVPETTSGKSAKASADEHAAHHPAGAASAPAPIAREQDRMKAMREMHDKMMNAKTPEERQALMAEHMKAMQGGMQMMKGMGGGMGGMGGMAAKGTPEDLAQRQQHMERRMDMMQMMMDMMMQRMPASGPAPAAK